jgi:S-adenosylmethionine synthetase
MRSLFSISAGGLEELTVAPDILAAELVGLAWLRKSDRPSTTAATDQGLFVGYSTSGSEQGSPSSVWYLRVYLNW